MSKVMQLLQREVLKVHHTVQSLNIVHQLGTQTTTGLLPPSPISQIPPPPATTTTHTHKHKLQAQQGF